MEKINLWEEAGTLSPVSCTGVSGLWRLNRRWQGNDLVATRDGSRHRSGVDMEEFTAQDPEDAIHQKLCKNLPRKEHKYTDAQRNIN